MARLIYLAPLSLFLLAAIYFGAGLQRDPGYLPSMLIDRPAPEFNLPAIEGYAEGFSSSDLQGRTSLVNVFGSWCAACLIEHPVLMRIERETDIPLYGLNWKDETGAGTRWLQRHGDPYTKIGDDSDGRIAIEFGVTGAPETFVVDGSGTIRHKHVGPISEEIWRGVLRPMIEDLDREQAILEPPVSPGGDVLTGGAGG